MTPGVLSSTTWFSDIRYCRVRSSSPFRDYADRNLGSSSSAHAWSLVNYVKFPVEQSLGRLTWLHEEVENPSDAKNEKRTVFFTLAFVVPWLYSHLR